MYSMFLVFGFGIVLELLLFAPVLLPLRFLGIVDRYPMQTVHSKMFFLWLRLMRLGQLVTVKSLKGRIPHEPCIIIANHPGLFDVIFLIHDIPKMCVLVKENLVKKLPLGPIFRLSGYIISPANGKGSPIKALMDAGEKIKEGYKFLIFPEGTRSPEGGLRSFNPGAFKISQKLDVPIQPVLLKNVPPFIPKEESLYLPPRKLSELEIEFMDQIPPPRKGEEKKLARETEELYNSLLRGENAV